MSTICVTNLTNETSEADIRELFSQYGSVQRVMMYPAEPDQTLQRNIYFELSSDKVDRAIAGVDGSRFKGSIIHVSHVAEGPRATEFTNDLPAGANRDAEGNKPAVRIEHRYELAAVEKAVAPEGGVGGDWYRYVLLSERSQITGLHRGTVEEVTAYATSCAELVNSRGTTGKSTRTCAYTKKK